MRKSAFQIVRPAETPLTRATSIPVVRSTDSAIAAPTLNMSDAQKDTRKIRKVRGELQKKGPAKQSRLLESTSASTTHNDKTREKLSLEHSSTPYFSVDYSRLSWYKNKRGKEVVLFLKDSDTNLNCRHPRRRRVTHPEPCGNKDVNPKTQLCTAHQHLIDNCLIHHRRVWLQSRERRGDHKLQTLSPDLLDVPNPEARGWVGYLVDTTCAPANDVKLPEASVAEKKRMEEEVQRQILTERTSFAMRPNRRIKNKHDTVTTPHDQQFPLTGNQEKRGGVYTILAPYFKNMWTPGTQDPYSRHVYGYAADAVQQLLQRQPVTQQAWWKTWRDWSVSVAPFVNLDERQLLHSPLYDPLHIFT